MEFYTSGSIMTSSDPANIYLYNIYVDTDNIIQGFYLLPNCNYPEAYLTPEVKGDNITFVSTEDETADTRPQLLEYVGPGNVSFTNVDLSNIYKDAKAGIAHFKIGVVSTCTPNDGILRTIDFHSFQLSLKDNEKSTKTNMVIIEIGIPTDRKMIFNVSDFQTKDFYNGIYGPFGTVGTFTEELHYADTSIIDYASKWNMIFLLGLGKLLKRSVTF